SENLYFFFGSITFSFAHVSLLGFCIPPYMLWSKTASSAWAGQFFCFFIHLLGKSGRRYRSVTFTPSEARCMPKEFI
ncbi:hypothetical protein, partial [Treponema sp. R80B11-R83G3]